MSALTAEIAAILRAPFPSEAINKLPRIWCKPCRDTPGKCCQKHHIVRCDGCRNNKITDAHLHLDYVGHAETTDRLLAADPAWTWEPMAFATDGLPQIDTMGGLWIRLTVAGVTRIGYGHADGKKGPDAVKEAIGDAIRNAAMRFGVALDLWGATFKDDSDEALDPHVAPSDVPALVAAPIIMVTQDQHRHMHALWSKIGYGGPENRANRLTITSNIIHRSLDTSSDLTALEAEQVISALRAREAQTSHQEAA